MAADAGMPPHLFLSLLAGGMRGGQIEKPLFLDPSPRSFLPPSLGAMAGGSGEREMYFWGTQTQGGARSSRRRSEAMAGQALTLGYNHVTPTEFRFGRLRSPGDERRVQA